MGVATAVEVNKYTHDNAIQAIQYSTVELNQPHPYPPEVSPDGLQIQLIKNERQTTELNICLLIFSGWDKTTILCDS
jgi:hypothetical protein